MDDLIASLGAALGRVLSANGPASTAAPHSFAPGDFSIHFFLQLAVILVTCRVVGTLGKRWLGQPRVVGEMIAGVLLGPSLLGLLLPEAQGALFPQPTRNVLYVGAQLGVGLYMFLVGTTLELGHFRTKAKSAVAVSAAGIVAPFLLAVVVAPVLLKVPGLFAPGLSAAGATLFLGACIALTAFPMLARIINERGIAGTALGTLSLTAGAFDDAVSWCVLALVLAAFGAGPGVAVLAIGGGLLYAAFIALFGRRLLAPLGAAVEREGHLSHRVLALTLIAFCLSAFLMDAVGIHAVFGGFLLGVCMPRGAFAEELRKTLEPITTVLLLPLFFTYSGLNTRLDMIAGGALIGITLLVLAASILAKFGACWAAARLAGEDNRTALGVASLMNSRGLMELIIINIGLQKGIIGLPLFAMLALMAILTTVAATPLFEWLYGRHMAAGERGMTPLPDPARLRA